MATQEATKLPSELDEETLKVIQDRLYDRLREPLLLEIRERLMAEAAEQPIPLYYDRYIASQIQRLEEAIERNAQRIMELGEEVDRRFGEMDRRFAEAREGRTALRTEMDRRFAEAREERTALRTEMDRRFAEAREERTALRTEMNHRFEVLETRIEKLGIQMRNWAIFAVTVVSAIVAILQLVLR